MNAAYLTVSGFARVVGRSDVQARKIIDAGKVPSVRTQTGFRLVKVEDAIQYREQRDGRHGQAA